MKRYVFRAAHLLVSLVFLLLEASAFADEESTLKTEQARAVVNQIRKEHKVARVAEKDGAVAELVYQRQAFERLAHTARSTNNSAEASAAEANAASADRRLSLLGKVSTRIVGRNAKRAHPGDIPYQVALVVSGALSPRLGQFCGGAIIQPTWVVTAAHCFDDRTLPEDILVYSGSTVLSRGGQLVSVSKILRHPRYDRTTNDYDIAVLQLGQPLREALAILPLAADRLALVSPGRTVTVSGWGDKVEGEGEGSDYLRYIMIKIVDRGSCNDSASYGGRITDRMLCAGDGDNDSCQGDSGGPLVAVEAGNRYLAGIVSWGEGCGRPRKYGVYTNVAELADWLRDATAR